MHGFGARAKSSNSKKIIKYLKALIYKNKMKKERLLVFLGIFILSVSMFVIAKPGFVSTENPAGNSFEIPAHAVQISDGVFSLGTARDGDGRLVQGFMFIHDKRENAKPPLASRGGGGSTCYAFLAKGSKWKTIEPYLVDSFNNAGLDTGFVRSNLALDINKWETAAGVGILGDEIIGTVDRANIGNLNGKNEVIFADVSSSGAIAVTIVWGIFSGPIQNRKLVEWDQIYDDVDFDWSSSGQAGKMDFENIATHELGHSVGMGHPSSSCTEETMYAFASFGETKKRDLNTGDIAGVNALY